jgi:hypothetical protein
MYGRHRNEFGNTFFTLEVQKYVWFMDSMKKLVSHELIIFPPGHYARQGVYYISGADYSVHVHARVGLYWKGVANLKKMNNPF